MTHILHRQIHNDYPVAVGGRGVMLFDRDGKCYIDASGGAAVSCLGHQHPDVIAAICAQIGQLAYAHTSFFTTEPAEALADELAAHAPGDLRRIYFVSGGSEGMETALKMARQAFVERGEPNRRRFVARQQSYHGNTLGALSVGGNPWRKAPFEPILMESHHIDPCYAYRYRRINESLEEYGRRAADALAAKLLALGPGTVIAFVAETVVGATIGSVPPAPGYFKRMREICDRHGVLLILDEVMCGMGRTGTMHAWEQEGIAPDLQVVAKGLGGGYQPIGGVLIAENRRCDLRRLRRHSMHGHTYSGHPLACAAGAGGAAHHPRDKLLDHIRAMGCRLEHRLNERFGNHHHVGDIRGRGLFRALELVTDRDSKAPFDPALKLNDRVKREAMERGLMVYPNGGTADGRAGDHVLLAPPFIVDEATIDTIVERLGELIEAAIAENHSS